MIRNSTRAFIGALIVIAVFHGLMTMLGITQFIANKMEPPSPDRAFQFFATRVAIDGALLYIGHWMLRSQGIATRLGYGLMGGASAGISYAFALSNNLLLLKPIEGTYVTASIMPIAVGMIAASLYAQFAGRDIPPELYADAPDMPTTPEVAPQPVAQSPAPVTPPPAGTFDGPVRVRTSMLAISIASVVPACTIMIIALPLFALLTGLLGFQAQPDQWSDKSVVLAVPAFFFFVILLSTSLPAAVGVAVSHVIARSLNRQSGKDYAIIGAAVGCIIALLGTIYVSAIILFPAATITGALTGAVYRRFAGIEPLPLPEAVLATDPAHLVGKNHPARHRHIVITNG